MVVAEIQLIEPHGESGDAASPPRRRVLVVSDQTVWQRTLDSVLGGQQYEVYHAGNETEAVDQVDRIKPHALIVHMALRNGSGLGLCSWLRASGRIDALTPVFLITAGHCSREDRLRAIRAGAWDCFSFPTDPELFMLKLDLYSGASLAAGKDAAKVGEETHAEEKPQLSPTMPLPA